MFYILAKTAILDFVTLMQWSFMTRIFICTSQHFNDTENEKKVYCINALKPRYHLETRYDIELDWHEIQIGEYAETREDIDVQELFCCHQRAKLGIVFICIICHHGQSWLYSN